VQWIPCKERLPKHHMRVAVLATNPNYQFGYHQVLAGWFIERYYDTVINEFRLTDASLGWRVTHWMELPNNPEQLPGPFDDGYEDLHSWSRTVP